MIGEIFLLKLVIASAFVVALSLLAENVSPRAAGILSGYPLGAALTLFFYGLEIGPQFASQSAVYTLVGLVATQTFVFIYYLVSTRVRKLQVLSCSLSAMGGYFVVIWLFHFLPVNRPLAIIICVVSIFVFMKLFKKIQNVRVEKKVPTSLSVLAFRAVFSALIILLITGAAKSVGKNWAGLFSAFPVTLYPLILIVHLTYDIRHVNTIIKNFPIGLGSLIAYCFTVSVTYGTYGIYVGTAFSFAAATFYLVIFALTSRYLK